MKQAQILQRDSNKKEQKKQLKAPEIEKAIKKEAEKFRSRSWKIQSHDGFYNV
jgi:hypothetical protein